MPSFRLLPYDASTFSGPVDHLFYFLCAVTGFFVVLISVLNLIFAIRYRQSRSPIAKPARSTMALELTWSIIPLLISMVMFGWGAELFYEMKTPPADALEFYGTAKQWMWKFQHPEGKREINDLHVPVGVPIKLTLTSEDTIHSFFVPDFRVKNDVLPGRYTSVWFEATRVGKYYLFCAEYCGTEHSRMVGSVYVMEPDKYQAWVSQGGAGPSMAEAGEQLFQAMRCTVCHGTRSGVRGPDLRGLWGQERNMKDGATVVFEEEYVRESILNPHARIVNGFGPLMPTFQGQISEENLVKLIAYIKSLGALGPSGPSSRSEDEPGAEASDSGQEASGQ